jgi:hypothetical protein
VEGGVDAIQAAPHDNSTFFDPVAFVVATTHVVLAGQGGSDRTGADGGDD